MSKQYEGYMSVEGSFIIPICLVILYGVIYISLTLFMRCYDSQNKYISDLKKARCIKDEYEVIYENMKGLDSNETGVYVITPLEYE